MVIVAGSLCMTNVVEESSDRITSFYLAMDMKYVLNEVDHTSLGH